MLMFNTTILKKVANLISSLAVYQRAFYVNINTGAFLRASSKLSTSC